jgi:peptide/nickel transport system permease protein
MTALIVRFLVRSVAVFLVVTFITFALVYGNGTGIARAVLGTSATPADVHAEVIRLGLNKPLLEQYGQWLAGIFHGDFGTSFFTQQPVTSTLAARVPVTLTLLAVTLILTLLFSVLLGVAAAVHGGWIDRVLQFIGVIGAAVPQFIVAVGLVFAFAIGVRLFPATGYVSPGQSLGGWASSLVLPVTAILVGAVGNAASQFRGSVRDVLERDFVRTLRTRGISERAIIFRHVLRNAAGPGLTVLALQTIGLITGVVIIEQVFALPGIGVLATSSAEQGDIPVVMGCILVTVLVVLAVNLVSDLLNVLVNPKARTR